MANPIPDVQTLEDARALIAQQADVIAKKIAANNPADPFWRSAATVFKNAYQNPIRTTAQILQQDPIMTYAGTGGWGCFGPPKTPLPPSGIYEGYPNILDPMWIRDACAQYHSYLGLFQEKSIKDDPRLASVGLIIEGIVRTCSVFLTKVTSNITVHAFKRDGQPASAGLDYEPDSLAYVIFLAYSYQKASGSTRHLDSSFWTLAQAMLKIFNQNLHTFPEGAALTRTPYRPSDDRSKRLFNIPINAFIAVAMEQLAELAENYSKDKNIAKGAAQLGASLRKGVNAKGISSPPSNQHLRIYAYETNAGIQPGHTDLEGPPLFLDDANVPSLLSLPYLGFCKNDDKIYRNTRQFVWSSMNTNFYTGHDGTTAYAGIGSAHTFNQHGGTDKSIWPMSLIIHGLTSESQDEIKSDLIQLVAAALTKVDCTTISYGCSPSGACAQYPPAGFMHESFYANNPSSYTRGWFAWVNALFGEWLEEMVRSETLPS